MTKITRIDNILSGTGIEREEQTGWIETPAWLNIKKLRTRLGTSYVGSLGHVEPSDDIRVTYNPSTRVFSGSVNGEQRFLSRTGHEYWVTDFEDHD